MSAEDSGFEAGSDSNESHSMSVGSSILSDSESQEIHHRDVPFNEAGAHRMALDHACSIEFNPVPQDYDFSLEEQHNLCPKFKAGIKIINRDKHGNRFRSVFNNDSTGKKLRFAANLNDIEMVHKLLDDGVDPNSIDSRNRTALHFCACKNFVEIANLLLERGANPNSRDIVGNTPLHLASITNHIKMITLLLKSGTDINALDNSGRTPLHLARSKLKLLHGSKSRHVKEEILQIIEMMTVYLQRVSAVTMGSQRDQLDLLSSFSNRLHLHQRQEEVDQDLHDLLGSLAHLSLEKN